jgi:integrase
MKANGNEQPPFRIVPFINPRTDSESWRVMGWTRAGQRIRENFSEQVRATAREHELRTEWLMGHQETGMQATKLTPEQIGLAEIAFARLPEAADILPAVDNWLKHGKALSVQSSERLDDAVEKFKTWLDTSPLRKESKDNLRRRVNVFVNSVPNNNVSDINREQIASYLAGRRDISAKSKDNDRRALSSFFSWCIENKWMAVNPCRVEGRRRRGVKTDVKPPVLSLDQCKALLKAAGGLEGGRLAPYVAVCLFAGLRPWEAQRLTWLDVNLKDKEISLSGEQTKTGQGRVITICDTLLKWLKAHEGKPFFPANWRRDFDRVKSAAGFGGRDNEEGKLKAWPVDVMRHTAISHYFRQTGSYGRTAEQFGNSESIIKAHYQARVSSDDTKKFYRLMPGKRGGK